MTDAIRVSVTGFSQSMGRRGDLGRRHFSLLRGVEGIEAHQRMQKNRGQGYRAEVPVQSSWNHDRGTLRIFGRIDGVLQTGEGTWLEEFKTTREPGEKEPSDHGVHVLQAEMYAWLWMREQGEVPRIRLEYIPPDPGQPSRREEWHPDPEELNQRIPRLLEQWLERCLEQKKWIRERNRRLRELKFPFPSMRPGQETLISDVGAALSEGAHLVVHAPTGIGKTLGILLPAFRRLGEGHFDVLMLATCRNTGKRLFEEAASRLFPDGPGLRMLTLVARDRICRETGSPCDCEACPLARGFYDRLPEAMNQLRSERFWDAQTWQRVAGDFRICPFGLMMHAAREADVLVGDVNYALDPSSRLEFLFGRSPEKVCLIIDEVHHLADRCRNMISASLDPGFLRRTLKKCPPELSALLTSPLNRVLREIRSFGKAFLDAEGWPREDAGAPDALSAAVYRLIEKLEASFSDEPGQPGDPRLELYRPLADFRQSMEHRQSSHVCTMEDRVFFHLCLDAAPWLRQHWEALASLVMFSGTLLPLERFREQTGLDAACRKRVLPSPYDPARFRVEIEDGIPLVWKARSPEMYDRLTRRILAELTTRSVKTLIYFPSYSFMEEIRKRLPRNDLWMGPVVTQPRGLQEEHADEFLKPFRESGGPVCGLAVLGGALNEGIDLPGEALESVIVVSVGLPGMSRERELIRRRVDAEGGDGFLTAYTWPGLIRVLQAMGRVIRGPEDRGTALLIDPRFRHPLYRKYLPQD